MDKISTDTDADSSSSIGIGQLNQVARSLAEYQPGWVADGLGVRGPQRSQPDVPVKPEPMEFGIPANSRPGSPSDSSSPCAPTSPPGSGTWFWGTIDGECQWVDTNECTPP